MLPTVLGGECPGSCHWGPVPEAAVPAPVCSAGYTRRVAFWWLVLPRSLGRMRSRSLHPGCSTVLSTAVAGRSLVLLYGALVSASSNTIRNFFEISLKIFFSNFLFDDIQMSKCRSRWSIAHSRRGCFTCTDATSGAQ